MGIRQLTVAISATLLLGASAFAQSNSGNDPCRNIHAECYQSMNENMMKSSADQTEAGPEESSQRSRVDFSERLNRL